MAVSNADYAAWDEKKTVECQCDPGYTGADCSLRKCPCGSDPIANVYTNDNSVYKIEWGQKTAKWFTAGGVVRNEIPNGQVHWTISYKDDYGDVWTTSAVTTYYQAWSGTAGTGSLVVGPKEAGDIITTPFFMDPDYQGTDTAVVNVDGVGFDPTKGTDVTAVYAAKTFSFDPSFIGEQVNASLQALPNDVVRYSYVHTVFNYGVDPDNVFIYPSMGVPKFTTSVKADGVLAAGVVGTDNVVFTNGVGGHCSPDSTNPALDGCANAGNFNAGKSVAVNNPMYRFPYWVSDSDKSQTGIDNVANLYTNCAKNALCLFVTIPEPEGSKDMTVNYKFKTLIRAAKAAGEKDFKPKEYQTTLAREISNHNGEATSLVTVSQVGANRHWQAYRWDSRY